ncbi:hypothetical protein Kallioja_00015 [Pseudomonas phage vB_PpuP-Kallioja]
MQVLVTATSSRVDDMIVIETTTTIGDQLTSHRTGYDVQELMDNRFLSGDLETRIEALRMGAEAVTIRAVELHFRTLMKVLKKGPEVTDVSAVPSSELQGVKADVMIVDEAQVEAVTTPEGYGEIVEATVTPVKKTRAKRKPKGTPKEILEAADKVVAFETTTESAE